MNAELKQYRAETRSDVPVALLYDEPNTTRPKKDYDQAKVKGSPIPPIHILEHMAERLRLCQEQVESIPGPAPRVSCFTRPMLSCNVDCNG